MVVAETIAIIEGIGLVTKSVSHIKGILKSKDADASQVAGHIDSLFNGHTQIEKKAKATSIVSSKWNALLKHRLGETADPNSIQSIATLKIQQRLADEEIIKVRRMINRRWPGAWDEILHERQERIKKAKSARVKKRD